MKASLTDAEVQQLQAELLDPLLWKDALERYAQSMKLAVALTDLNGHRLGPCHNPQPVWVAVRNVQPEPAQGCPFCLSNPEACQAAARALHSGKLEISTDRTGLSHLAVPLILNGEPLGVLLAGQVFNQFPELLQIERLARSSGASPQGLWDLARRQQPISRKTLTLYGELLDSLARTFLEASFGTIRERQRTAEILELSHDLDEQKRIEVHLQDSKRFLRSLLDALTSHIAVLDENGVIVEVNAAWQYFATLNAYADADYGIGANYLQVCGAATGGCLEGTAAAEGIRDVLSGRKKSFTMEYPCHTPSEQRWFLMRVTRFASPGPVRVVVAHENITPRKLAEEELQRASRRKDEFLATLAHELRNPLAPISNSLQILKLSKLRPEQAEQTHGTIERQVQQLIRLVDDLLDISRVTQGKIELRKEYLSLDSVVQTALEGSLPLIESRRHRIFVTMPPEPICLDADRIRLTQILQNLLNNAAKYTEPGGQIEFSAETKQHQAVIRVRDNGIGIPTAMLPRIFDMFVQVNRTLEKTQGGLGIGLSLVRGLVELHGGTVEARSRGTDQGSEFVVRLPLQSEPEPGFQPSEDTLVELPSGQRILVVDDNQDAADSCCLLLQMLGLEASQAYDGPSGLQEFARLRPHVILLDIGLPGMSGYDVARAIRKLPEGRKVKLIALTGWGQKEDRLRSKEAGFDHHLVKPVDLAALQQLLTLAPP